MVKNAVSKEQYISDLKIVKILSTVPHDKAFYFYTDLGCYTGEAATDLVAFAQKLETISADSIKFHFQRNDFQNWIKTTVGDNVLAEQINQINRQLAVDDLRKELAETVQTRIAQLKLQHGQMIRSQ
ncbi:MAG TPA: DUF5752 family protein [Candidatus Acidoferrum sp.]|nr:DUF5752 family protein [Candidatus Acidoferrum sp.]